MMFFYKPRSSCFLKAVFKYATRFTKEWYMTHVQAITVNKLLDIIRFIGSVVSHLRLVFKRSDSCTNT